MTDGAHARDRTGRGMAGRDEGARGHRAGSTDPAKIREAILATKKFPGAEGEYNFDQNGDGLHGYNIVKNDKGKIVFDKHIEFND